MISKPVLLQVQITELPMFVEQKSKQTAPNNTPEPMSLPINDLSFSDGQKKKPEFAALFYFSLQK